MSPLNVSSSVILLLCGLAGIAMGADEEAGVMMAMQPRHLDQYSTRTVRNKEIQKSNSCRKGYLLYFYILDVWSKHIFGIRSQNNKFPKANQA